MDTAGLDNAKDIETLRLRNVPSHVRESVPADRKSSQLTDMHRSQLGYSTEAGKHLLRPAVFNV